jgi:hypothetical protein
MSDGEALAPPAGKRIHAYNNKLAISQNKSRFAAFESVASNLRAFTMGNISNWYRRFPDVVLFKEAVSLGFCAAHRGSLPFRVGNQLPDCLTYKLSRGTFEVLGQLS